MSYYRDYASREIFYYLLPFSTVMYFIGDVASFELLYVALIDFGIAAITVTTFLNYSGLRSVFVSHLLVSQCHMEQGIFFNLISHLVLAG
jgi:hypothetical protein